MTSKKVNEYIKILRDQTKKVEQQNQEMIDTITKTVKEAGGLIFTDAGIIQDIGGDPMFAIYYNEDENRYVEGQITALAVVDNLLYLYISNHHPSDLEYINEEERNFEFLDSWYKENEYYIKGGMVSLNPTLYNICEILHEYL